jgi:predicted RNA-binding protein with PUA-like domain
MQVNDLALFYHSVSEKAVVGVCKVSQTAYPDPTDETGKWVVVDLVPVETLAVPVTLAAIKATEAELQSLGKNAIFHVYPGTHHAFFNDTREEVYDAEASATSWARTVALFRANL